MDLRPDRLRWRRWMTDDETASALAYRKQLFSAF